MGIDDKSSHPELCSEVADGVTHTIVSLFREPDAGNPPVRFDEREQETEPCQTGLRRALRKQRVCMPPGDYRYCACSRLHSLTPNGGFERKRLVSTIDLCPNPPQWTTRYHVIHEHAILDVLGIRRFSESLSQLLGVGRTDKRARKGRRGSLS